MALSRIKYLRKQKHMTQGDLADAIKVDTSVISKYESGIISPSYKRLKSIADVLGVEVDALLSESALDNPKDRRRMIVRSVYDAYSHDGSSIVNEDRFMYAEDSSLARDILANANDICQLCGAKMPVIKRDETCMLETHYIEWLSRGGQNVSENIIALCPTCHKYIHMLDYDESVATLKEAKEKLSK